MKVRGSGMLLHVTSLPSPSGVGDLGPAAYRFIDFLSDLGQCYWQMLPIGPTSPAIGNSPYSSFSAFAGNPFLISPAKLVEDGYLEPGDAPDYFDPEPRHCHYEHDIAYKEPLLRKAFERSGAGVCAGRDFSRFCANHADWLEDWALFSTIKNAHGGRVWCDWPAELRDRNPMALEEWRSQHHPQMEFEKFVQYLFFRQWEDLRRHAGRKRVHLVGDAPIYVSYDSADVWTSSHLFKLDEAKKPVFVAGVPPDYFSETGQRWGNPVYDWDAMRREGFGWWVQRMGHNIKLFDYIRLDHFRGFAAYWEIPASEETAVNGEWVEVPGRPLFDTLLKYFSSLPLIAEDLGYITADVRELKQHYHFPGMKILQFGFGGDASNPDAPHNHESNTIVYTGTHDNNTVHGWFTGEASKEELARFQRYIGKEVEAAVAHHEFIRLALSSRANTAICPLQDVYGLGADCRMNTPSKPEGNWNWRLLPEEMDPGRLGWYRDLAAFFGRV